MSKKTEKADKIEKKRRGNPGVGSEHTVRVSLTLLPEHVEWIDKQGRNRSAVVRDLVERAM